MRGYNLTDPWDQTLKSEICLLIVIGRFCIKLHLRDNLVLLDIVGLTAHLRLGGSRLSLVKLHNNL